MTPRRAEHRAIAEVLGAVDSEFLESAECYFGGGTYLSLILGVYRVSRDVDFLCAARSGFRALRETITQTSLGSVFRYPPRLAREVRADRDGIRTFLDVDDTRIKFEIVFEGRIELAGAVDARVGVPALTPTYCIAEKLLANADRGLDESTHSRDLVDLAFIASHCGKPVIESGLVVAEHAYGGAVRRYLELTLEAWQSDRARATASVDALGIEDTAVLRKGMRVLRMVLRK
jgi:hypothetical protein